MNKIMKKQYGISRIILSVITVIIFSIITINEGESWRLVPFIFAAIVFIISYPSSVISRRLINIGNKIKNKILKTLYYVLALPLITIFIFWFTYYIILSLDVKQWVAQLFFLMVVGISIILPYIQTIIVLILIRFIKEQ